MANQSLQRLRAEDVEDLAVISALMQECLTCIQDMAFDAEEKNFMLVARRFRQEAELVDGKYTQVGAALVFGCINWVQHRGIVVGDACAELKLLTIATEPGQDTLYRISLIFEGGGEIRLASDCLHCRFEEFGDVEVSHRAPDDHVEPDLGSVSGDELGPKN